MLTMQTVQVLGSAEGPVTLVPYAARTLHMPVGPVSVKFSPLEDETKLRWGGEAKAVHLSFDLLALTAVGNPAEFERTLTEADALAVIQQGPARLITLICDGVPLAAEVYEHQGLHFVFAADQVALPLVLAAPADPAPMWPEFATGTARPSAGVAAQEPPSR